MEIALERPRLTSVVLGGALGKKFGKQWNLAINGVREAFQMIDANEPGFMSWVRTNADKYDRYHIRVTKHSGEKQEISKDTVLMEIGDIKEIRITPIITGRGAGVKIALGVVALVVSYFFPAAAPYLVPMGISLIMGGILELLSPTPKVAGSSSGNSNNSYYFDGPVNTVNQGVPVTLIYGKQVLVGSQTISAKVTIDQLM